MKSISLFVWTLRAALLLCTALSIAVSIHGFWVGEWWSAFGLVMVATFTICNVASFLGVGSQNPSQESQHATRHAA